MDAQSAFIGLDHCFWVRGTYKHVYVPARVCHNTSEVCRLSNNWPKGQRTWKIEALVTTDEKGERIPGCAHVCQCRGWDHQLPIPGILFPKIFNEFQQSWCFFFFCINTYVKYIKPKHRISSFGCMCTHVCKYVCAGTLSGDIVTQFHEDSGSVVTYMSST